MERDQYAWKKTYQRDTTSGHMDGADKRYPAEKRPIYMERDPYTWKETYLHEKRPIYMKRDLYI